jgi:hypothetical protein
LQNIVLLKFLKILSLFFCIVFSNNIKAQCVGTQTASMSPAGPYVAGQVVTITYTLSSFTQVNANWIIAFDINYGVGWSSISPVSAPGNPGGSSGYWIWDTQNTYPSGLNFGPGYRFQNSSWWNPDYGTSSTGPFTLSFQLTVGNSCLPQDLSIDLSVIGDCQTGGWSSGSCCSIVPYSIYSGNSLVINPSIIAGTNQTICNGGVPNNLTANGSSSGTYSWSPPSAFTNPNLQNPSFNSGINTTSIYTVTFTDINGCIATDSVTITTNPIPTVMLLAVPNPACIGDNIILTASTSIPVNRYRFQYNTGSGWVNMTSPGFQTTNPVTFLNISTTTQFRVKVREDNGCTNSSWSSIITVPINTIVTPPISHN